MDKKGQEQISRILEKYIKGDCTPAEEKIIGEWYDQLELSAGDHLAAHPAFANEAEAYLRTRLSALPPEAPIRRMPLIRRAYIRWSAAAVLALILTASLYLYFTPVTKPVKAAAVSVVTTGAGQLKKIVLPDSSVVWLNKLSRLEWTGDLKDSIRLVKLAGEGFFRISPDAARPFIVEAGHTRTLVLGTEFNVEAYTEEREIKVALLTGKVQFSAGAGGAPALLQPGKMVTYRSDRRHYQVTEIGPEANAWTKGLTVFNEVPLSDAITRLAKRNGWELAWKRKDRPDSPVSAVFSRETPIQMLQGIAFTHHLKFTLQENILTIY